MGGSSGPGSRGTPFLSPLNAFLFVKAFKFDYELENIASYNFHCISFRVLTSSPIIRLHIAFLNIRSAFLNIHSDFLNIYSVFLNIRSAFLNMHSAYLNVHRPGVLKHP